MCMNSATMFATETVRVRLVTCHGPHEAYSPYKGFIPIFIYKTLEGLPYSVHRGHKRIIDYVENSSTKGQVAHGLVFYLKSLKTN